MQNIVDLFYLKRILNKIKSGVIYI